MSHLSALKQLEQDLKTIIQNIESEEQKVKFPPKSTEATTE